MKQTQEDMLISEAYGLIGIPNNTSQHVESRTMPKYPASEYAHPQFRVLPRYSQDDKKEEVRIAEEILKAIEVGDMNKIKSLAQELLNIHVA